ncbi:hypothetical protein Dcae01_03204 [Deinococcus caeni]|uniref:Resolvase/invertase-type recombinase catalytic domain-containing protein n=1 Tax=Deinococcus caeni TaxID=569127 RepID=A0ABP9UJ25_9DEIO
MSRFAIYTRVSTGKQDDNTSQSVQEVAARAYGEAQGWQFHGAIHDTQTGKDYLEREGVKRVLRLLESGRITEVVFFKVDRVGRDSDVIRSFVQDIYEAGGRVSLVNRNRTYASAREFRQESVFETAVAEHERMAIEERMQSGRMYQFKAGSVDRRVPFGYDITASTKEINGRRLRFKEAVVLEAHALTIRAALRKFVELRSVHATLRWLNINEEYVGANNTTGQFSSRVMNRIIDNALLYAGEGIEQVYLEEKRVFRYPPIIDLELAVKVRETNLLRAREVNPNSPGPFRGLAKCTCGRTTYVRNSQSYGERKQFHVCATYEMELRSGLAGRKDGTAATCRSSVDVRVLKRKLMEYLERWNEDEAGSRYEDVVVDQILNLHGLNQELQCMLSERDMKKEELRQIIRLAAADYDEIARPINEMVKDLQAELDLLSDNIDVLTRRRDVRRLVLTRFGVNADTMDLNLPPVTQEPDGTYRFPDRNTEHTIRRKVFATKIMPDHIAELEAALEEARQMPQEALESVAPVHHLFGRLETLREALEREDWAVINSTMADLGLRFVLPLAEPNTAKRRASIRIEVDFQPMEDALLGGGGPSGSGNKGRPGTVKRSRGSSALKGCANVPNYRIPVCRIPGGPSCIPWWSTGWRGRRPARLPVRWR